LKQPGEIAAHANACADVAVDALHQQRSHRC
jgi:hypothetical protein